jgi:hypothetical protein
VGGAAPVLRLGGRRTQDVDALAVAVRSNEAATLRARGRVKVRGSRKRYRLKPVKRRLAAGRARRVRLRLSRRSLRAVKRALRRGKRVTAVLTLTATDAAGHRRTVHRTVKLKN